MTHLDPGMRAQAPTIGLQRTTGTEGARQGVLGGHDVTVGQGAKPPSLLSRAATAIGDFFKSIGSAFTSLADRISTAYQDFKAERAEASRLREFNATRDQLLDQLPTGVTIDQQGNLGGSYQAQGFPTDPMLGVNSGKTFAQAMQDGATAELQPKTHSGKTTPVPVYAGIPIAHQAANDFYRMDMAFGSGPGNFDVRRDVTMKGEGARNGAIVQGLRAFTGSDNATTILSSVLTQNLSRPILECFANPDGSRQPMSIEQGKVGGPFQVRDQNGTLQDVEPSGIGGMQVSVDRDQNGNFEVTGHWEMFLRGAGRASDTTPFQGMDGALVRADGRITFTVDAQAAAQGNLVFVTNPSVNVDFSGKMAS
jgi:hypothetical protein